MKRWLLAVCSLLLACAGATASAAIRAHLDSNQIAPGDTVQLTLEHDGQTSSQPDLTPLQKDFDILGESTSSNVQIINGHISSGTELDLTLSPKRTGQLTIPPLSWGSEQSPPLTLTVSGAGGGQGTGASGSAPRSVFITSAVTPAHPYVLAAVQLTVKVYAAATLYRPSLDLSTSHDVLVRQVGDDEDSSVERNGQSYSVVTRHYLLFPQHSGSLTLPGPTLTAQVASSSRAANDPFSSFFGAPFGLMTTRPIQVQGDPIVLQVRPRPASAASAPYWLPARSVTLEGDWQPRNLQAHVGDPVTVDLKLRATGLTAAQLPDLTSLMSLPSGLKVYPEQAKLKDTDQGDTVEGSREQTVALIADQPGHYSFPRLAVTWWDTSSNQARQAILPARTLVVLPAPGSPTPATPAPVATAAPVAARSPSTAPQPAPAQQGNEPPWRWISLGLVILWLATLAAWLLSRRPRTPPLPRPRPAAPVPPPATASQARSAFIEACRNDDAPGARRHLLAWAAAMWGTMPSGLSAVAARLDDPEVTSLLRELDRACFASDRHWSGQALATALGALPATRATVSRSSTRLAPLYR